MEGVKDMHVIIRKGNGKFYTSAVFGYYSDKKAEYNYGAYYIVFDEAKEHLVIQQEYNPRKKPQLELMVLIIDPTQIGWNKDDYGFGGVDFLPEEEARLIIHNGECPEEILQKCRELDAEYIYTEYNDINDDSDIERLMSVSGWFHDAVIKELEEDNNVLRVLFDGVWGCRIEMFFEGDVSYNTISRDFDFGDPYWGGSTIIRQDGYVYFVDEDEMKVEDIKEGYCWFKAQKVRYRVIPD